MSAYFFAPIVCALFLLANAGVDYPSLIGRIRDKLVDDYRSEPDAFSECDIARLKSNDWFVKRYLIHNSDNEEGTTAAIAKMLRYRRAIGINDHNDTDFPAEFYALNQFTPSGEWSDGTPTFIYSMAYYFPSSPALDELYAKFLLHLLNKVELIRAADEKAVYNSWILFDNSSLSNIDHVVIGRMLMFHRISMPSFPNVGLISGLSWFTQVVWSAIKMLLPDDLVAKMVVSNEIAQYIDLAKADKCYGGSSEKSNIPDGVKGGKCLDHLKHIESADWEKFYKLNADRLNAAVKERNAESLNDLFKC